MDRLLKSLTISATTILRDIKLPDPQYRRILKRLEENFGADVLIADYEDWARIQKTTGRTFPRSSLHAYADAAESRLRGVPLIGADVQTSDNPDALRVSEKCAELWGRTPAKIAVLAYLNKFTADEMISALVLYNASISRREEEYAVYHMFHQKEIETWVERARKKVTTTITQDVLERTDAQALEAHKKVWDTPDDEPDAEALEAFLNG